jgi:predicted unusual protein kinase regulating ubiquinone biosynthesis (AarF/ABC1/UbiB family)
VGVPGLRDDVVWALEQALDDTHRAVASAVDKPHPAAVAASLADLARSSAFLWLETSLKTQARVSRRWLPRALVLATVAADLYTSYALQAELGRWCPSLADPDDLERQHRRGAARVLSSAVALGGTLIKAGQFASARPDLVHATYAKALSRLQDRVPAQPWSTIETVLGQELGRPPTEVFASIEPRPVAAASLAQVHRARLVDGRQVAVKVQYPDLPGLIAADLVTLDNIAVALEKLQPDVHLRPIVQHLRTTLPLELDFRREAQASADLGAALAHRPDVLVPCVVGELSTERVLVTDFVHGIKITDRQALQAAGIDPAAVARALNDVYAEQILQLGYLHGDPHPGNLLVQPGPRLVLLDHGLTVRLQPYLVDALRRMVHALSNGDFAALTAALHDVGLSPDADLDLTSLLHITGVLLGLEQVDGVAEFGQQLTKHFRDIPVELITVGRALGMLSGITRALDPELDTFAIAADRAVSAA